MKVIFAHSISGRSYFEKFLNKLPTYDRSILVTVFDEIESDGLKATRCDFRQIEGKLWEIKIKTENGGYRFFYTLISNDQMYVLHF